MEDQLTLLSHCALFAHISPAHLRSLLQTLGAAVRSAEKGEALLWEGYENRNIGIVLQGGITAEKTAPDGTQLTITHMGAGGIFGDVLSGSHTKSPVSVTAVENSVLLWLPIAKILQGGCADCAVHAQLLQNLIGLIADKYFALDRRIDMLMLKSVREKVLYYLKKEAQHLPDGRVLIPLTRAGLAQYLGCERTALCRELSRMQKDGMLQIEKRVFRLLK